MHLICKRALLFSQLRNVQIFNYFVIWIYYLLLIYWLPTQKHRGFVRNLELIQEELSERQLTDKNKEEEDEEKEKMSKLNHKNGNGDGKLEEQGLIDPNENKIGERTSIVPEIKPSKVWTILQ